MTDVVTSVGVIAGLVGAVLTGWTILDPVLAVIVALNILWQGWHVIGSSVQGLMDRAVDRRRAFPHPRHHLGQFQGRAGGARPEDPHRRPRHLHRVPPDRGRRDDGRESHVICDRIEEALRAEIPSVRITIHVEPDDEAKLPPGTAAVPFA